MKNKHEVEVVEVVANEELLAEVGNAKEIVKQARKAKLNEYWNKTKKVTIEAAKYAVPAILTGIAMKAKYESKAPTVEYDTIEGEFEVTEPTEEVEVTEETGE